MADPTTPAAPVPPVKPVDPIEAEVAAAKLDKTAYIKELAQAVQAELNPSAPDGDCSPYMEDAEKFMAMAFSSQAILKRYHDDNETLKELTRKNAREKAAKEAQAAAEASKPAPVASAPQTSPMGSLSQYPGTLRPGIDPTLPLGGQSQGSQGAAAAVGAQTPNPQTVRGEPMPV